MKRNGKKSNLGNWFSKNYTSKLAIHEEFAEFPLRELNFFLPSFPRSA